MENNAMPQKTEMSLEESEYNALVIAEEKALRSYQAADQAVDTFMKSSNEIKSDLLLNDEEMHERSMEYAILADTRNARRKEWRELRDAKHTAYAQHIDRVARDLEDLGIPSDQTMHIRALANFKWGSPNRLKSLR